MIATFYDYFFSYFNYCCFTQIIVLLITVNQLFLSNSLNTHLQLRYYYLVHIGISYQIVFLIQKLPQLLYIVFLFKKQDKQNMVKQSLETIIVKSPNVHIFFSFISFNLKKRWFLVLGIIYIIIQVCVYLCVGMYVACMYYYLFFCRSVVGGVWNLQVQGIEIQTTIMQQYYNRNTFEIRSITPAVASWIQIYVCSSSMYVVQQ